MSDKNVPKEVQDWERKFARAAQMRQPFEEQWYYNLAFYAGRQYAIWDKNGVANRLIEPPAPRNRVRLITNKVKPIVRREITKMTKEEHQAYVTPNTTDPTDVAAAKVAESLVDWSFTTSHYNEARRRAAFWTSTCGNGFIKTFCPGEDENIVYEPVTPFHLYVPYVQEETIKAQPYIFHARAYSPEQVYDKYGIECKPDAVVDGGALEQRLFSALGIRNTAGHQNLTFVKEVWIQPCKNYPEGGLIVIADKKIIYAYSSKPASPEIEEGTPVVGTMPFVSRMYTEVDFPFEHGELPFHKFDHIPMGRFYSDSVVSDLIPLQKEYNRGRSQLLESKNLTSKPQMVYIKGSIDPSKVNSQPGLMIGVQPGFESPKYIVPPEMPQYSIMDFDRIQRDMDDISNQFEVAKGRTPPGVEAASAIAYLQEENDEVLHNTIASIEAATEGIGRQTLGLIQQMWTDKKITEIVSKNNQMEAVLFKVSNLKNNTDFRVEAQSMAPRSRAARQAFIVDLMDKQVIGPDQGLRYLQMSETNRLYDELQVDSKHAKRENFKMSLGEDVPLNPFDNHAIHLYEHELFMKSQEYEALSEDVKMIFLNHHMITKMMIQGQMVDQAGMGAPPVDSATAPAGDMNVGQ